MTKKPEVPIESKIAEETVIGSILADSKHILDILEKIRAEDFYHPKHRLIFQTITELAENASPIDYRSVTMKLEQSGNIGQFGNAAKATLFLGELVEQVGLSANYQHFVTVVHEKSTLRRLAEIMRRVYKGCHNGHRPEALVNEAQTELANLVVGARLSLPRSLSVRLREWVIVTPGEFNVTSCYQDMGSVTTSDKAAVRKALQRLVQEGLIVNITGKKGTYRPVMKDMTRIRLKDANKQGIEIPLRYPFQLENWYKTFPKTIIVVAGVTDAGKTAFLLDFVNRNLGREDIPPIVYFTSEMGVDEFYDRASQISGFDVDYWDKHLAIWDKADIFEDVVNPDAINIIDNLELYEDPWKVAGIIHRIWDKLKKGIAIIALHKTMEKEWGKGGQGSAERARLYLSLEPGSAIKGTPNIMRVLKIKNWRNRLVNIKGKEFKFKLINGCSIKELEYGEGQKDTHWQD